MAWLPALLALTLTACNDANDQLEPETPDGAAPSYEQLNPPVPAPVDGVAGDGRVHGLLDGFEGRGEGSAAGGIIAIVGNVIGSRPGRRRQKKQYGEDKRRLQHQPDRIPRYGIRARGCYKISLCHFAMSLNKKDSCEQRALGTTNT